MSATGRRLLGLLVLGLVVAGGLHAWSQGWLERGLPENPFVAPPPPAVADPAAVAAQQRERDERRRLDDMRAVLMAMRVVEATANRENRCLAMPDPLGNQWPDGAAAARCALLRKPVLTLAVMRELLARGTPSPLRRVYADLLTAHFDDPARREQIFLAYQPFDGSDAAAQVARAWLRTSPRDPYALAAAGWQKVNEVVAARGGDRADRPSPESAAAAAALAAEAWPLLDAALAGEPRLLPVCVAAARLARLTAATARQQQALQHCLGVDPASFHVLQEQALAAQPRWGGSASALEAVAAQARAGQHVNPLLATLAALAQIAAAEDAPAEQAQARWEEALRPGPAPAWALASAARASTGSDPWRALLLYSQAMRFDPCADDCHRRERLRLLVRVHEWSWVQNEAQAMLAQAPDDFELLRVVWQAREALAEAAAGARGQSIDPTLPLAETWIAPLEGCLVAIDAIADRRAEAASCSAQLAQELPANPYAWYARVRYLRGAGEPGAEVALRRMEATIDRSRPEQTALLDRMRASQPLARINPDAWIRRPN